jgi:hypothetical protein
MRLERGALALFFPEDFVPTAADRRISRALEIPAGRVAHNGNSGGVVLDLNVSEYGVSRTSAAPAEH